MAKLGHPVIGPQSYWKLTFPEMRIYREGKRVENERSKDSTRQQQGGRESTDPHRKSKRRRDREALQKMDAKLSGSGATA